MAKWHYANLREFRVTVKANAEPLLRRSVGEWHWSPFIAEERP
jgi:hypothetical protein